MCIRDSYTPEQIESYMRLATEHGFDIACHAIGDEANTIVPVSYTHLRAHETVLDLVCRLLLEKKKTTQDKQDVICTEKTNNNEHS